MKIIKKIIVLVIIFILVSCETAYDSIPTSQENYAYYIYLDEHFDVQKVSDISDIPIQINRLTPILAYASELDECPQGCIYPYSTTFDSYGGFSAWILYKLLRCSKEEPEKVHQYLSHFNWQRFSELIEKYENPWKLNQDIIFENISDRTFNVYSVKELTD